MEESGRRKLTNSCLRRPCTHANPNPASPLTTQSRVARPRYVAEETARVRAEEFRARFERMHNIILPIVVVLVGFLAMHTTGIGLTWEKCTKMYRTLSK